jgi:hypothetical protein
MERLQIRVARIAVLPVDVVHFDPVVMLEEQSAVPPTTLLRFKQPGQSRTGTRMPSLSDTPVPPVPIVGAPVALTLDMPLDGHLTVRVKVDGVPAGGGVAKARRVPIRCQYRSMAHPMLLVECRRCAQERSLTQVKCSSRA